MSVKLVQFSASRREILNCNIRVLYFNMRIERNKRKTQRFESDLMLVEGQHVAIRILSISARQKKFEQRARRRVLKTIYRWGFRAIHICIVPNGDNAIIFQHRNENEDKFLITI